LWDLTRYALEFFRERLPFAEMHHHDELTGSKNNYCFARPGRIYAIYLPRGGTTQLDLGDDSRSFIVQWFNPRAGGKLVSGSVRSVKGPGQVGIGQPPKDADKDWVALVQLALKRL